MCAAGGLWATSAQPGTARPAATAAATQPQQPPPPWHLHSPNLTQHSFHCFRIVTEGRRVRVAGGLLATSAQPGAARPAATAAATQPQQPPPPWHLHSPHLTQHSFHCFRIVTKGRRMRAAGGLWATSAQPGTSTARNGESGAGWNWEWAGGHTWHPYVSNGAAVPCTTLGTAL